MTICRLQRVWAAELSEGSLGVTDEVTTTEYRRMSHGGLNYLEFAPSGPGVAQDVPTLVFLHGSGEHGRDLDRLKAWGLPKLLGAGRQIPYRVLCPQCAEGADWDLGQLADLVEVAGRSASSPVFLSGYSRGATAAWKFAARFGHLLAGVLPVAGRWDLADAERLAAVPVLAVHGELDERPNPAPLVEAILRRGGEARLWLLAGQGHFVSDLVYGDKSVYDWMADRTKAGILRA